jgi:hypothetical protein
MSAGEEIGVNGGLGGNVEDETVGHIFCSVRQFVNRSCKLREIESINYID